MSSLEGHPNYYVEVNDIVPCYGSEGGEGHGHRQRRLLQPARYAVIGCHRGPVDQTNTE